MRSLNGVLNQYKKTWTIAGDVAKAGGRRMLWGIRFTRWSPRREPSAIIVFRARKRIGLGFLFFFLREKDSKVRAWRKKEHAPPNAQINGSRLKKGRKNKNTKNGLKCDTK